MNDFDKIRHMRKARGLKGYQLAERLQVSAARISMLEKDEQRGAVTLKMMERVAQALDCRFEYQLVPNTVVKSSVKLNKNINEKKPRYRVVPAYDETP
jgi:predicted DNA-binding mobile mystery protein A